MNNLPARLYLDLDRTLFNTDAFVADVRGALGKLYGIDAATFTREVPKFYVHSATGGLRHYNLFAHLAAHNIAVETADRELRAELRGRNYLYDDAGKLLRFLGGTPCALQIISYGTKQYQRFKYSLVPELAELPFEVVFSTKDTYLAEQPAAPSWLVDDKLTHHLPPWCTMVHIDRQAPVPFERQNAKLWRINSLQSVETLMTVGYNEPNQKRTLHEAD